MKKDKDIKINENFKKIEKLIIEIKENINNKLEENINTINELNKRIKENKINIEKNKNIINILKNEIFNRERNKMKNKIYEIYNNKNENIGKGFLIKIKYNNNIISILIINNRIEDNKIIIKKDNKIKEIEIKDRNKYINNNICIIEIKEEDNIKNYIEIDNIDNILSYKGKTIYILDNDIISIGKIKEIEDNNFKYESYIENNIIGLPIINIINNKIIGINNNNNGLFIKYLINDFININEFNKIFKLNIIDVGIEKLNLNSKYIGNKN